MTAPAHGLPQVPDQCSCHDERHSSTNDYAPLGVVIFGSFKVDPSDDANELVADFDPDAFDKVARNDFRLGQSRRECGISHRIFSLVSADYAA